MSLYRKVAVTLWRLPEFRRLSPIAKLVLVALLTSRGSAMIPGLFEGDQHALAGEMAMALVDVDGALGELTSAGVIDADLDSGLISVLLVAAYRDHAPANESVVKGWAKAMANAPDCDVRRRHGARILALWPEQLALVADTFRSPVEPEHPVAKPEPLALVPMKPPTRPKADQADVAKLIEHYCARWIETRKPADGKPPALARADKMQAAALVRAHGIEQAIAFVDRYLADDDPWLASQGHALKHLASRTNGYRAGAKPTNGMRSKSNLAEPRPPAPETKVEEL